MIGYSDDLILIELNEGKDMKEMVKYIENKILWIFVPDLMVYKISCTPFTHSLKKEARWFYHNAAIL